MTLRQKQWKFVLMVSQLICWCAEHGYEVTFGEAYRDPEWADILAGRGKGIKNSLHCSRLAIDLNLFKDGKYLSSTKDHEPLGLLWESIGGTWGGRFSDGNHYSLAHGGRK